MGTGKYKIGARVRDEDGDEGVIVGKRKGERLVEYVELGDARIWVRKSSLTAIDEPPATAEQQQGDEPKFKVGDRVRLLTDEGEGRPAGSVGTVYKADRPGCDLDVIFDGWTNGHNGDAKDGSSNHWYLFNQDVELLTEWQPKVGDRVRFKENGATATLRVDDCGQLLIEFDERQSFGHNSYPPHNATLERTGCAWWVHADQIEPLPVAAEAQGAGNLEDDVTAIFDELESADTPVSADATATPIKKRDLVTLARPAMVTGFDPNNPSVAHVVLGTGGAYTLPVAALVAA